MAGLGENGEPDGHKYECDEVGLASIPGAEVIAGWDYVITPDGYCITDSCPQARRCSGALPHIDLVDINKMISIDQGESQFIDEEVLFLSAPADGHFGHWVSDYLPRLILADYLDKPDLKIFIPNNTKSKLRETLTAFVPDQSRFIEGDFSKRYAFRKLHFLVFTNNFRPNPILMRFVRASLRPEKLGQPEKRLRLFLNREDVGTRSIQNWQSFSSVLSDYGFESVNLSNLSIAEQRKMFSRAEIIMGVFGTNLHSMFLVPDECCAIVLQLYPKWAYWYDVVARSIGVSHIDVPCEVAPQPIKKKRKMDMDAIVDCDLLRSRLDEVCANLMTRNTQ